MSNTILKALVGTAAGVVIVAGGVWGFTAWQRHQTNESAQKECITNQGLSGLQPSTVAFLEERRARYGEETVPECLARMGFRP